MESRDKINIKSKNNIVTIFLKTENSSQFATKKIPKRKNNK